MNSFHRTVARAIGGASGSAFTLQSVANLSGGCINEAIRLEGTDGSGW